MTNSYEIVRLKLVNFTHFNSILGYPEFEINRTPGNPIIVLVGGNGSGKSLLMSHWSPKPTENTNNRKRVINEKDNDEESIKEVDIIKYDINNKPTHKYYCRIIYSSSTNCSIIEENLSTGCRVELNENGLVGSYEDILNDVFDLDKRYVNITYLSPQITSLVSMSPSIRYGYISSWLPDISSYINAYKTIFKKINTTNRQIKLLESDIGDISVEKVDRDISMMTSKMTTLENKIEDQKIIRMKLTVVRDNLASISKDILRKSIEITLRNKYILNKEYNLLIDLDSRSKKYRGKNGDDKLKQDITINKQERIDIKNRVEWIGKSIDEQRIRLKEVEYNLGLLKDNGESLPDISVMLERIEESLKEYEIIMLKYKDKYTFIDEIDDNFTMREFKIVESFMNLIYEKCKRIQDLISIPKLDNVSSYSELIDKRISEYNEKIKELDIRANKLHESISILKNTPIDESILQLIPDFCDTTRCGVILEINRLLSPDKEINKLQIELESIYSSKAEYISELDNMEQEVSNIVLSLNYVSDINHSITRDKEYISMLPSLFKESFSGSISSIISNLNILLRDIDVIGEFTSIRDQFKLYTDQLKTLKEKEISLKFVRNMNSDITNITSTIDSMGKERRILLEKDVLLIKDIEILEEVQESINNIRERIDVYNVSCYNQIDIHEKIKNLCADWYYREKISRKISELDVSIESMSYDYRKTKSDIDSLRTTLNTKKSLLDMRDRLLLSINNMNLLLDAWNPKSGIPSFFIKNFLIKVHMYSNVFLKKLNGDALKISKFEIGSNAREFPIEILKEDGSIIPDVSQCSEGEIALLTLAISLALLNIVRTTGGYNILRIDELDSHLDTMRRKQFVEIIQEQLDDLNSKQLLIITHNDNFNDVPADIILFPGASKDDSGLSNKNILLDMRHISLDKY